MKTAPFRRVCLGLCVVPLTALAFTASAAPPAQQAYLKASNTASNSWFGYAVAVSGDTMVVGAAYEDSSATGVNGSPTGDDAVDSGAAYVFVRNGTNWVQQAYLKASNAEARDLFGLTVAISGDTIVVGAYGEDSNATAVNGNQNDNSATDSGAAYVFVRTGTNWTQQAYLKASNAEAGDNFGLSVAVSGDTIVVGAVWEDSNATGVNGNQLNNGAADSGAAYVFVRNGTNWTQQAYLKASNTGGGFPYGDEFGFSVAVSGDTIVVGAISEDSNAVGVNGNQSNNSAMFSGAAYIFARTGETWSQQAYLKASNTKALAQFGRSVTVSGDTVVIGAPGEDSSATGVNGNQMDHSAESAGAAYVFVRSGTTWSQQAYLKASNTGANDAFGNSVSLSGDTIAVGASGEDSGATGLNGDQADNFAINSGAAYVFVRNGTSWSQQAYLKSSDTQSHAAYNGDAFGISVALSGDTVAVGCFLEDSKATGVDGDSSDNSALDSGSAYVFTGLGIGPHLTIAPDGDAGYFIRFAGHAGVTYHLERAPTVTGTWSTIATVTAPVSGLVEVRDTAPLAGQAFYRVSLP